MIKSNEAYVADQHIRFLKSEIASLKEFGAAIRVAIYTIGSSFSDTEVKNIHRIYNSTVKRLAYVEECLEDFETQ